MVNVNFEYAFNINIAKFSHIDCDYLSNRFTDFVLWDVIIKRCVFIRGLKVSLGMFPSDVTSLLGTQGNKITRINSAVVVKSLRRKRQGQLNIFAFFVF